ncbi:MAG: molybdenum cofactor guanylyltransferase MobA [Halioglobus sp.]
MSNFMTTGPRISGLILAGGAGRRAGGADKGLLDWQGRPLIEHVYRAIVPQVDEVFISCNRNRNRYAALTNVTRADLRADYQGPLAGMEAAATNLSCPLVLVIPCDTPTLPSNLAQHLLVGLESSPHDSVAYATTRDGGQYLCALLRTKCLGSLTEYLDGGGRAVRHWYDQVGAIAVDFDDQRECFLNLNNLSDLTD